MRTTAILLVLLGGAAVGQEDAPAPADQRERVLAAIGLPRSAQALRQRGVEKAQVREALREARRKKVKPKETKELLDASAKAVDEHGPIDNFGAFVKARLGEGLRGRELAAAIRAEHQARGRGKGRTKDKRGGGETGDRPGDSGRPEDDSERPEKPEKPEKPRHGRGGRDG